MGNKTLLTVAERWDFSDDTLGHWVLVGVFYSIESARSEIREQLTSQHRKAWSFRKGGIPEDAVASGVAKELEVYRYRTVSIGQILGEPRDGEVFYEES